MPICWPAGDRVTGGDADVGLVAVPDLGAVLEGLDGLVAVGAGEPVSVMVPLATATMGVPAARRHVQAGVVAGPHAAGHAEAGGEAVAAGGQVPLVLGDLAGARLGGLAQGLQLGVALGGLLLGGLLELDLGGVLEGLALGVTADRPLARVAGEPDGVGAGQGVGPGGDLDACSGRRGAGSTVTAPAPAMPSATTPTRVGMAGSRPGRRSSGVRRTGRSARRRPCTGCDWADQQDAACCGVLPGGYPWMSLSVDS